MQGTWVQSLVWEDTTCHEPTKPPCIRTTEVCMPRACALRWQKSPQWEACTPQRRVVPTDHGERKPVHSMKTSAAKKKNKKESACTRSCHPKAKKPSNSEDGPADAFTAALITLLLSTFLCLIRPPPPSWESLVPDEERRTFAFHTSASFHFWAGFSEWQL